MATRKSKFDAGKEVRKLARERVGRVPAQKAIVPRSERKPKHRKQDDPDAQA